MLRFHLDSFSGFDAGKGLDHIFCTLGNSHFNGDRVRGACRLRRSDQADGEHCDNYRAISNGSGAHDDAKADSLLIGIGP